MLDRGFGTSGSRIILRHVVCGQKAHAEAASVLSSTILRLNAFAATFYEFVIDVRLFSFAWCSSIIC